MDEQRLGQVFRDAVAESPPASFGHDDVVAASRRATARRRGRLAGGTLLGVAVLATGLVVGGPALRNDTAGDAAVASGGQAESGAPRHDMAGTAAAAPGGQAEGDALRTLDATRCGPIDAELAADLTALLVTRGIAASGPAGAAPQPCPAGSRAAAVPVPGGMLSVLLVPQAGRQEPVQAARPDGERRYSVPLDGGRTLEVTSMPGTPGQPAPLADEVPDLARELAAAL